MKNLVIKKEKFELIFNKKTGCIQELKLYDGKIMNSLFYENMTRK